MCTHTRMRHTNSIRIDTLTFSLVADQSSTHAAAKTTEHLSNATPLFQISCIYYSLEANERIASSLYVFCAPILLCIIAVIAQRVMIGVSTVRIPP